jgi:hypothetical protein
LHCLPCLSPPIFLKNFPCHGVKQVTPCQFWLQGDSISGRAHAPSLWAETKPGVYSGTPRATLWESCLIMASDDCFSSPSHLMSLFPETAIREWRFHVAESVPVLVNGRDLEAQVIANPSGVCHASRLCLPLPYLRCWGHLFCLLHGLTPCLLSLSAFPSLGLLGPCLPLKTCNMVFQLVCQASQTKVTKSAAL